MEDIAPPLALLLEVKQAVENGKSIRIGVLSYTSQNETDPFAKVIRKWLIFLDQGMNTRELILLEKSQYRRSLLAVLEKGMNGHTIFPQLLELECEIVEASTAEIEYFLSLLPFKMMVPLLLFQFPAFLLLLLGPILFQVLGGFTL